MSNQVKQRFYAAHRLLRWPSLGAGAFALLALSSWHLASVQQTEAQAEEPSEPALTADEWAAIRQIEQQRIATIDKAFPTVVAIYGEDVSAGGGSGVLIDSTGYVITNHHVVEGAGTGGWAGLSDRRLYRWELLGIDPGGDLAMIRLLGRDEFPCSPLGDSNVVKVGDWAMAMGNPFLLAEDQRPTVTLGIVSGIERYQEGAGGNTLVYGNCIQIDSSINPGNSGGPLFNMDSEVIGINGRGSFHADRGRVNVGLGYAISSEQIKYFYPDLLATKFARHGTLDAQFGIRGGRVVCDSINLGSQIAQAGLALGDELIAFEGIEITSLNHFTNLISMLPEGWPVEVIVKTVADNEFQAYWCRLDGLAYEAQEALEPGEEPAIGTEGQLTNLGKNLTSMRWVHQQWADAAGITAAGDLGAGFRWTGRITEEGETDKYFEMSVRTDGTFDVRYGLTESASRLCTYDGSTYELIRADGNTEELTADEAGRDVEVIPAMALSTLFSNSNQFGTDELGYENWILEGSDKAQNKRCFRLRATMQEGDHYYLWLSAEIIDGSPSVSLLKSGRDENAGRRRPAVTYNDYQEVGGVLLPHRFGVVDGISEELSWEIIIDDCQPIVE